MATISLGSSLVNKITQKIFSDSFYQYNNGVGTTDLSAQFSATTIGMGGYGGSVSTSYVGGQAFAATVSQKPSSFSLMKGVVPSAISDINTGQRASDTIVTFSGPAPTGPVGAGSTVVVANALLTTSSDTAYAHDSQYVNKNDFLITVSGGTATWSALNLSFLPRMPTSSGTPAWFWFRTFNREHTIFGTVGATGSGSDLELQTYEFIDSSKQYTLFNATMATFEMTQDINY